VVFPAIQFFQFVLNYLLPADVYKKVACHKVAFAIDIRHIPQSVDKKALFALLKMNGTVKDTPRPNLFYF
jgi:hypothetical protein